MRTLSKIFAIARTEFRFGYRRPGPLVIGAIAMLTVALGTVMVYVQSIPKRAECIQVFNQVLADPQAVADLQAAGIMIDSVEKYCDALIADFFKNAAVLRISEGIQSSWYSFLFFALVFLVASAAPAIPADQQFGASEWLRSLPITGGMVLAGKILGLITSALAGTLAVFFLFLTVTLALMHTFPFTLAALLLAVDVLPLLTASIMLGVLVGVLFRKRFAAAFAGLFAGIFNFLYWIKFSNPLYGQGNSYDSAAYSLFRRSGMQGPFAGEITSAQVIMGFLIAAGILVLLGLLARLYLYWKENY